MDLGVCMSLECRRSGMPCIGGTVTGVPYTYASPTSIRLVRSTNTRTLHDSCQLLVPGAPHVDGVLLVCGYRGRHILAVTCTADGPLA